MTDGTRYIEAEEDGKVVNRVPLPPGASLEDVLQEIAGDRLTKMIHIDDPGPGGAYHQYIVLESDVLKRVTLDAFFGDKAKDVKVFAMIDFQKGSVEEVGGVNGCTDMDLLQILKDRLECFQAGEYACDENAESLRCLNECIEWQNKRNCGQGKPGR